MYVIYESPCVSGSTNSLVNPTTKGANDKGDELVQQHNKSAQRVHSNDDHLSKQITL